MKTLLLIFSGVLFFSCKKDTADPSADISKVEPDYTVLGQPETVNTEIIGYVTNELNGLLPGTTYLHLNNNRYVVMNNGMFSTGNIITDKNATSVLTETGSWDVFNTYKSFPVTSAIKNYTRIKAMSRIKTGTMQNNSGGIITLGNNGSIEFGTNSFYLIPSGMYPGSFSPHMSADIYTNYFNPEDNEYAMRLPAYLAGDDGGQRWFLKSYGAISLKMFENTSSGGVIDFYNASTANWKLPIAQSMLSIAPDSIATWKLMNGTWIKGGMAKKINGFYETKINKATVWTIAKPVKGVYLTVNVRTDSNATVTNTTVRIKSANLVLAESQTDANGNAVCFVPSNEQLSIEVLPDYKIHSRNGIEYAVGEIKKAGTVNVKLPTSTLGLSTLDATVLNCNGQPVKSGMAKATFWDGREYFLPILEGRFATAFWINGNGSTARIQVNDYSSSTQNEIVTITCFSGSLQRMNFYSCQNSSLLYCNYTVDNNYYTLSDNASGSTVYMVASKTSPNDFPTISTQTGNVGISFTTWPGSIGIWKNVAFSNLVINGVSYPYDNTKENVISYTRFDGNTSGFIEGWFSIFYKDAANTSHKTTGNFKVKRTF